MKRIAAAAFLLLVMMHAPVSGSEVKVTLKGSRASMLRQNEIARELDFSFLRTTRDVNDFADEGRLVPVPGGENYRVLADWPYARPVVRDFIEILAADYRAGCGEPLVVTSLTRPVRSQPRNASPLSVHPAGMAVDLRVSSRTDCVAWLQDELLSLESRGLLDATREYRPPHFHVAVFPEPFAAHLAERAADSVRVAEAVAADNARAAREAALQARAVPTVAAADATAPFQWPALFVAMARLILRV